MIVLSRVQVYDLISGQAELEMKMDKAFREIRGERWSKILGYSRKALNVVTTKSDAILKVDEQLFSLRCR